MESQTVSHSVRAYETDSVTSRAVDSFALNQSAASPLSPTAFRSGTGYRSRISAKPKKEAQLLSPRGTTGAMIHFAPLGLRTRAVAPTPWAYAQWLYHAVPLELRHCVVLRRNVYVVD